MFARGDGNAVFVERDRGDDGAGRLQRDMGAAITGAFDPGMVATPEQRVGDHGKPGLRGRHDQDLTGFGLDAAVNGKMRQQGFLQRRMVDGPVPAGQRVACGAPQATAPQIVRKLAFVGEPGLERPRPRVNRRPARPLQSARP